MPIFSEVSAVLDVFLSNPVSPAYQDDKIDLNPTRDPTKAKTEKIEATWEWRNRVRKSIRCQLFDIAACPHPPHWYSASSCFCQGIYRWESNFQRRYLSTAQCWAWWSWYLSGHWMPETADAVRKIHRNMVRKGLI